MQSKLTAHHGGQLRRECAEAQAETIINSELAQRRWTDHNLRNLRKSAPEKMKIAARLRRETVVSMKWIADRLSMGTANSANVRLYEWMQNHPVQTSSMS